MHGCPDYTPPPLGRAPPPHVQAPIDSQISAWHRVGASDGDEPEPRSDTSDSDSSSSSSGFSGSIALSVSDLEAADTGGFDAFADAPVVGQTDGSGGVAGIGTGHDLVEAAAVDEHADVSPDDGAVELPQPKPVPIVTLRHVYRRLLHAHKEQNHAVTFLRRNVLGSVAGVSSARH